MYYTGNRSASTTKAGVSYGVRGQTDFRFPLLKEPPPQDTPPPLLTIQTAANIFSGIALPEPSDTPGPYRETQSRQLSLPPSHEQTLPGRAQHSTALPQGLTAPLSPAPQRSQPDPREGQAVTVLTPQLFPTAVLWAHGSKPGRSPAAVSELKVMILAVITLGVRNRAAQTRACCSHSLPRGAFFTSVPLFPLLGAPPAET